MTQLSDGYEPRFDLDAEVGRQGELWVADLRAALAEDRVEVKTKRYPDAKFYVEYACLRADGWQRSGIATSDSPLWMFVVHGAGVGFVFTRRLVEETARRCWRDDPGARVEETDGSHPTKGVLVSLTDLLARAPRGV